MKNKKMITWKRILAFALSVTLALYSGVNFSDHILKANTDEDVQQSRVIQTDQDTDNETAGDENVNENDTDEQNDAVENEKKQDVVISENNSEDTSSSQENSSDNNTAENDVNEDISLNGGNTGEDYEGTESSASAGNKADDPEKKEEKSKFPAVTLKNGAVAVKAPEGALPEGAYITAVRVGTQNLKKVESAVEDTLENDETVGNIVAYDVTIFDKNGNEIQPRKPVKVTIGGAGSLGDDPQMFHMDSVSSDAEKIANGSTGTADHFSIFAVVVTAEAGTAEYEKKVDAYNIKIRYEDENGKKISGVESSSYKLTPGTSVTIEQIISGNKTITSGNKEYTFENAYFYWTGHYGGPKCYVTSFTTSSSGTYGSYLRFSGSLYSETGSFRENNTWDYNNDGVLHLVYNTSEKKMHKVKYHSNIADDMDEISSYEIREGSAVIAMSFDQVFGETPAGYTFKGWADSKNGTVKYTSGKQVVSAIKEDKELYAVWDIKAGSVRIMYQKNPEAGGTLSRSSEILTTKTAKDSNTKKYVTQYTQDPNGCTAMETDGYDFLGWYKGDTLVTTDAELTRDMLLQADTSRGLSRENDSTYKNSIKYLDTTYTARFSKIEKLTLKADSKNVKYDGKEKTISTYSGLPEGKDFSKEQLSLIKVSGRGTDAGEYEVVFAKNAPDTLTASDGTRYEVSYENGKLTIDKRNVTLMSASKERVYDGTELRDDKIDVSGDGFAEGEGAEYKVTGSQLVPGESVNAFDYELNEGTKKSNYNIEKKEGKLKVIDRKELLEITVTAKSFSGTYDGSKVSAEGFEGLEQTVNGSKYTVSGITSKAEGTDVSDSVSEIPVEGKAVVKDEAGNDVTKQFKVNIVKGSLSILPRRVIMTSASDEKEYDGKALTNDEVKISGDGFIKGEGASFDVSGSITRVGFAANTFEYTLNDGTSSGNYNITKSEGTLTIKNRSAKYSITLKANSGGETYNGKEQSVNGFETLDFTVDGNEYKVTGVQAEGKATDAGEYQVGITGTAVVSDSEGKDVTDQFAVISEPGKLKISPRKITMKSADAEKEYDGKPITADKVELTKGSFAEGQGASYNVTGSQTLKGSSENKFSYVLNEGTIASNYEIKTEPGTLSITDRTEKFKLALKANSGSFLYDGKEHKAEGFSRMSYEFNDVTYQVSGIRSAASGIHVSDSVQSIEPEGKAVVKDPEGNDVTDQFEINIEKGEFKIIPRSVTMTSGSAQKAFDGAAVRNDRVEISGDGFADGEGASYEFTSDLFLVGAAKNTFTYKLNEGTQDSDYNITLNEGDLVVTNADLSDDERFTVNAPEDTVYNGKLQHMPVIVKDEKIGRELTEGQDYSVEYSDALNVGEVKVIITGAGVYTGKIDASYKITPAVIDVITENASKQYDGKTLKAPGSIKGFAGTESAPFKVTGARTEVGSTENTYVIDWDSPDATANKKNYVVRESVGSLTVSKNSGQVVLTAPGAEKVYDGKALTAEGKITSTGLPEGMSAEGTLKGSRTKAGIGESEIEKYKIINADGKDVTDSFDKIETVAGQLIVTKAPLSVATAGASKIYDGKELTSKETRIEGLAEGEEIRVNVTGSQTEVGNSENLFTIDWLDTDKDNYELTEIKGTLTVVENDADVVLTAPGAEKVYDGKPLTAAEGVTASGLPEGFSIKATATGTITDAGSVKNVVEEGYKILDASGKDKTKSFKKIRTVDGTLTVTPRPVSISSASASKYYDGNALSDESASAEGLAEGDDISVRGTGHKTDVGETENTIEVEWKEVKESNYTVTMNPGRLSVMANVSPVKIKAQSAEKTYDGSPLTADDGVEVTGLPEGFTAEVSIKGSITDAGSADNIIEGYRILNAKEKDVTKFFANIRSENGTLKVNRAQLDVRTESASKEYDGKPLTAGGTANGLAEGEKIAFKATGSITSVGTAKNTYEIDWKDAETTAKSSNYTVKSELGTLTVSEYSGAVTVTTEGETAVYDGKNHGAKVTVSGLPGCYKVKQAESTAEAKNVSKEGVLATADKLVIVNNEGEDVTERLNLTFADGTITVTPAVLEVSTESASKVYDGKALTAKGSISGFAGDEYAPLIITGSRIKTGDSLNTYRIDWDDEKATAKEQNYIVNESVGTLHVTENRDEITVITKGGTFTYDGKAHGAEVKVSELPEGYRLVKAASTAGATNVTDKDVKATADDLVIYNEDGEDVTSQLNIKYVDGTIRILPAVLEVKTQDAEKEYDAEPLTAKGSVTGFVNGETATFRTTGSRTEVGVSANSYELVWDGTAKAGNYVIKEDTGSLRVVHYKGTITAKTTAGTFEYDGRSHSASVEVTGIPKGYELKTASSSATSVNATKQPIEATADTLVITDANGEDVTDKLNIEYKNDMLSVTPRKISVTTYSATKIYDGEPLSAGGHVENVLEKDIYKLTTEGSQKSVGSSDNTYSLVWEDPVNDGNYEIANESVGKLTVTESAETIVITAGTEMFSYDGVPHGVDVTVSELPSGYRLEKAESSVSETDVTGGEVKATADDVVIRNAEGEDVTDKLDIVYVDGSIQIAPAKLTVTTPDASKIYDGIPLTAEGSVEGFIGGEQAPLRTTGSQTEAGSSSNTYEIGWNDNNATAKEKNYEIDAQLGTLTVKPIPEYNLEIRYVDENDKKVADTYVDTIRVGSGYGPVASPEVKGYVPEYSSVEGIMPEKDVTVTVKYSKAETADTGTITARTGGSEDNDRSAGNTESANGKTQSRGSSLMADTSKQPAGVIGIDENGDTGLEILGNDSVPLADGGGWALINLISMIITVLIAAIALFGYFRRNEENDDNDKNGEKKKHGRFKLLTLIPAVVSVIMFFITEDISLAMRMTDSWTIWMVLLAAAGAALAVLTRDRKKEESSAEEQPA